MQEYDSENNNRNKKKICRILIFVLIGAILLMSVYGSLRRTTARFSRDFLSPFLRTVILTEEGAFRSIHMTKPKRKLAAEIHVLQRKNLILESRNQSLKQMEEENKKLRALLNLPQKTGFEPVIAEISGRTASLWRERFVINKGWADGIRKGDAVAAPDRAGNIVFTGIITEVSAGTAVVSTLFSGDCKLSVALASDGSSGGMEMLPEKDSPVVRYLPLDGDYQDQGLIVTSGISENTPGGIPVARVKSQGKEVSPAIIRDQLYAELEVVPLVRIDSLRAVVIFTKKRTSEK